MTTHITLILYDIISIKEDICNAFSKYSFIFFNDQQSCINHIESLSKSETIFLITSLSNVIEILRVVHGLKQLDSVFIYSTTEEDEQLIDQYSKVIGIFYNQTNLFECIEENIDLTIKQIESFKFYEQKQKSTRELTKESGSFLWLRLFKAVVLKLPHNEESKLEMIEKLKETYHNNRHQLKLIENFNQKYKSEDAIKWYTGQPFLYKQLNRALRTEDIELLYKFRYFISDLSKNLYQEYEIFKDSLDSILKFYRGVKLLNKEAKKLEENIGKLISTNGYLSTSFNRNAILSFADGATDGETNVIFEIEYDFDQINSVIAASIAHYSHHRYEEEVLFDLDATFEILSINNNPESNILEVKMKATDEGAELAQQYIEYYKRKLEKTSIVVIFGYLLAENGQYDKSEQYFERLLKNPNEEDLPSIYHYMGNAKNYQGDYETALKYYQQSYDMLINAQPSREFASSYLLNNIGWILNIKGQYNAALDYHIRALNIRKTYADYFTTSTSLANIGIVYKKLGKYNNSLDYLKEALEIKEKYLPDMHNEIADILNTIASVYDDMDELDISLEYHQRSLEMREKCLPNDHEDISISLGAIGNTLTRQQKYNEALDYYIRALKIKENIFPNGHLNIALSLNNIGYIYYKKNDYILALDSYKKSLKMRENLFSEINDPALVQLLTNFGLVYIKLHEYNHALTYSIRALNLSKIIFPVGHITITECFTNIGIIYREMKDYIKALEYFNNALENQKENSTKSDLLRLLYIYDNMGICFCNQGDIQTGLEFRLKGVRLLEKVYPRFQYACTADTVGDAYFGFELYDIALECFFISLNIKLKCHTVNNVSIAETLMNIGDVFIEKEKNNKQYNIKGRCYYEKALDIYTKNKHVNTIHILNRIGDIYENIHKYRLAHEYYRKALETFMNYSLSDGSIRQKCENNLARIKWLIK